MQAVIQEGVCDRTPAIRDELSRRWQGCHRPKPLFLTTVRSLDLSRRNIDALRSKDLYGLHGLRRLDLSDNALQALPAGLFAGVEDLREVSLQGNPGAQFALTVQLTRLDVEPWVPGPARLAPRTEWAGPFDLVAALSASPAEIVANALENRRWRNGRPTVLRRIEQRRTTHAPRRHANTALSAMRSPPCFRGFRTAPGPTLTLFRQPPRALPIPELAPPARRQPTAPAAGNAGRGDDPLTDLHWTATSSDDTLATVRIADGSLEVTPQLASSGTAEIILVATDTAGLSTTLRFNVYVEFHWPSGPTRGWRNVLGSESAKR